MPVRARTRASVSVCKQQISGFLVILLQVLPSQGIDGEINLKVVAESVGEANNLRSARTD